MTSRTPFDGTPTPTLSGPGRAHPSSVGRGDSTSSLDAAVGRAMSLAGRRMTLAGVAGTLALALAACSPSNDTANTTDADATPAVAEAAEPSAPSEPEVAPSLDDSAEGVTVDEAKVAEQVAAYADVIREFAETLQSHLQTAMAEGGPGNAIEVCSRVAPEIAASISEARNLEIGRTSLRVRNIANEPDQWERLVLEGFEDARASGQDAQSLRHHEVVIEDGQPVLRYMQAIPTGGLCLTCHGAELHADVRPALERLYPEDRAVGFAEGDVRGAFTIRQRM